MVRVAFSYGPFGSYSDAWIGGVAPTYLAFAGSFFFFFPQASLGLKSFWICSVLREGPCPPHTPFPQIKLGKQEATCCGGELAELPGLNPSSVPQLHGDALSLGAHVCRGDH